VSSVLSAKAALRSATAAARSALAAEARERARSAIRAAVMSWCVTNALPRQARVAAYEPLRTEPGSIELLSELTSAGFQVIVPITRPDNDLDWVEWMPTRRRPAPLGIGAISDAALVLVPAFAADATGRRLGRGGGSYDRALARVPAHVPICALLFRGELLASVPVDEWDLPVTAAVTPDGWRDLGP